ncbi:MAG: Protein translocase subunit SecF [Candidatus Gottesmanbacteria bacterium GW2011_GWA1_43_11]|uniref:Protein-export membrane protein SecF n=1 Tax=Candidatus Gottesmanbacteria bacterium GW2011_GWA1_43_11 TaxID=1618436 RepID=A0A0G1EK06_9BACT|nr:MAG: Protein translocase subunit SecF [Candidatus Gottesmanbacteria bacterium GW2011_GWA1_43_11]
MDFIKYKSWFFALSLLIIIPGLVALATWRLKLGIDFSGGTLWEVKFSQNQSTTQQELQNFLAEQAIAFSSVVKTQQGSYLARLHESDEAKVNEIKDKVTTNFGEVEEVRLETVGPTISRELAYKALAAVGVSILGILVYITWAFRKIPKPASSLAFGICTIVALAHDVIVVVGIFAILGHFKGIEIDSLFITALLTVIGFSVHDTIVVFDRIRENLTKYPETNFPEVVNHSLNQTLGRSLNTSLTAIFVLFALLLFGGESTRIFVLALLIGIISGTYSSIFNASPLLVVWHQISKRK